MTEKLELEQKAKEWIKDHSGLTGSYEFVKYDYDSMQEAYIAGATENGIQWHDLRKDPNDLPKESHVVQDQDGDRFYYFRGNFYYESDNYYSCKPSLWCETPQFKE